MKRLIFIILIMVLSISGCSNTSSSEIHEQEFFAMDTFMRIKTYGDKDGKTALDVKNEVERLDKLFSRTDKNSQISKLNSHAGDGENIKLDDDIIDILSFSKEISKKLPKKIDITIAPVMDLWGFTHGEYNVPDEKELENAISLVDIKQLKLNEKDKTARLNNSSMKVDLGAVAKGYTAFCAEKIVRKAGIKSALIDLGGNITVVGHKIDGSKWQVAIQDPTNKSDYICYMNLNDVTLSTSGGYERYFEQDGIRYHHIIDIKNGYPAENGLLSVTVISKNAKLTDALSTALFVAGEKDALEFWKKSSDFELVLCTDDNRVILTQGLKDIYEPLIDTYKYEIAYR